MKKLYIALILCVLSVSFSFGQERKGKEVSQIIYYSFTNASSIDQVNELKQDIEKLKSVVKVKVEFKAEREAGQVVVTVTEMVYPGEGDYKYFDIRDLKRLVIKHDLMPNEIQLESVKK